MFFFGRDGLRSVSFFFIPLYPLFCPLVHWHGLDCLEWSVCASAMAFYISFRMWPLQLLAILLKGGLCYVWGFVMRCSRRPSVVLYK